MDDFEKEYPNFDWKETSSLDHPDKCRCPKHEYIEERIRSVGLPFIIRLCPSHYDAYWETHDEMLKKLSKFHRFLYKFMVKLEWIIIVKLKHMESELCFWCKFGTGGRGIKIAPIIP